MEMMEAVLWCAALGTWLMLAGALAAASLRKHADHLPAFLRKWLAR